MSDAPLDPEDVRFNLRSATVLCVDRSAQDLKIVTQILRGFGVGRPLRAVSIEDARKVLTRTPVDLLVAGANLGEQSGYDLVRWLRRSQIEPNRYVAAIIVAGYTPRSQIERARDCGASFVVAKPLSPAVLLDRILWTGRAARLFVECEAYVGPDRRFKNDGPPDGAAGRRRTDLTPLELDPPPQDEPAALERSAI